VSGEPGVAGRDYRAQAKRGALGFYREATLLGAELSLAEEAERRTIAVGPPRPYRTKRSPPQDEGCGDSAKMAFSGYEHPRGRCGRCSIRPIRTTAQPYGRDQPPCCTNWGCTGDPVARDQFKRSTALPSTFTPMNTGAGDEVVGSRSSRRGEFLVNTGEARLAASGQRRRSRSAGQLVVATATTALASDRGRGRPGG